MVEFPGYVGPSLFAGRCSKYIPIIPCERRCERKCCSRTGLPLMVAKADSIHSVQGLTVGDGRAIERVLIRWSADAESKWPGIFYVAGSRAEKEEN